MPIGCILWSPDFFITSWNPAAEEIFGFKADEVLRKHPYGLIVPRDAQPHVDTIWRRLLEGDTTALSENENITKDRRIITCAWSNTPLKETDGTVMGILSMVQDITERKRSERELERLRKELEISNRKLQQLALKDPHTGLYNYRYLKDYIDMEFSRAERQFNLLSVIMIDIDYFKSINDVYGHPFGDLVLKQFARQLNKIVRTHDIVIRYGGEEFIIVSSNTNRANALILAQRILDKINLYNFGDDKHIIKLKLSLAVASYPEDTVLRGMDLIKFVDQILNKAKEDGGNRVCSSLDLKKEKELIKENPGVHFFKDKIYKLTKRANQSLVEATFAFAKIIKLKDHYTGEHVERSVYYTSAISQALNLPKDKIELIKQATMLHDLGKVGISEQILHKKSKLNTKEFTEIKKHPQIGVDIIRPIQSLQPIIPLLLYHHERWDGKGYPFGLKKENIPLGARIVAIADVYQALVSDRPYRRAYPKRKAMEMIKENSGTQFDPDIVDVFINVLQPRR